MSDIEEKLQEIFAEAAGFESNEPLFAFLAPYVSAESDQETLQQIEDLARDHGNSTAVEIGYVAVWKYLTDHKNEWH